MAGASRATGTAVRLMVAVLMLAGFATVVRRGVTAGEGEAARSAEDGPCSPSSACGPPIYDDLHPVPTVASAEACHDAAYLCEGLRRRYEPSRALRYRDDFGELRVHVAWPYDVDVGGLRYQQQAARGVLAWDGRPLRIVTDLAPRPEWQGGPRSTRTSRDPPVGSRGPASPGRPLTGTTTRRPSRPEVRFPDITVSFSPAPSSNEIAETSATWGWNGRGAYDMMVSGIRVATHETRDGASLPDAQIAAAAAHAMGHALGLPHSSSSLDVMYPGGTAITPSPDDLRALRALYALPNGAEIVR